MHVLIIDDDHEYADALTSVLEQLPGTLTRTAASPKDGNRCFLEDRPDVVLLDLDFHGEMNGVQLLRSFRLEDPTVPVIVVTGKATVQSAVEVMSIGAFHLIEKPVDQPALVQLLERAFVRRRELQEASGRLKELDRAISGLTDVEIEVLQELAEGESPKQIAARRNVSVQAIHKTKKRVCDKLDVESAPVAVRLLYEFQELRREWEIADRPVR